MKCEDELTRLADLDKALLDLVCLLLVEIGLEYGLAFSLRVLIRLECIDLEADVAAVNLCEALEMVVSSLCDDGKARRAVSASSENGLGSTETLGTGLVEDTEASSSGSSTIV